MSLCLDIHKKFPGFSLDVSLDVGDETLAILGESGSGKSLTLSCIAGIVKPDEGKIIIDGVTVFDSAKGVNLPPQRRHTGLMFQDYALFPNMTVAENIRVAGRNRESKIESEELIRRFGLESVRNLLPSQISGGQKQRTALARTLLSRPKILMLDEPFSALDSHLRFQTERELSEVFREFCGTVILVSHSMEESYRLCRKIAVIHGGHVEISGAMDEVFSSPKTKHAAILTGCKNISRAKFIDGKIHALDWDIELQCTDYHDDAKYIGIRSHRIIYGDGVNSFTCRVIKAVENPFSFTVMLLAKENAGSIFWEADKTLWREIESDTVRISFPPENLLMLKE